MSHYLWQPRLKYINLFPNIVRVSTSHWKFIYWESSKKNLFVLWLLINNIWSSLLNQKRFVFPSFDFSGYYDDIHATSQEISINFLHVVYDKEDELETNLKKAPKINKNALHPWKFKQNVCAAWGIFRDISTYCRTYCQKTKQEVWQLL